MSGPKDNSLDLVSTTRLFAELAGRSDECVIFMTGSKCPNQSRIKVFGNVAGHCSSDIVDRMSVICSDGIRKVQEST